jgi:hypothetical protein
MRILLILACFVLLTGGSCSPTLRGADVLGRIDAGIDLPPQPTECGQRVQHIALAPGQELHSIFKRERTQLDIANDRIVACYRFNEDVRARF